jgi:hypothetical protein
MYKQCRILSGCGYILYLNLDTITASGIIMSQFILDVGRVRKWGKSRGSGARAERMDRKGRKYTPYCIYHQFRTSQPLVHL